MTSDNCIRADGPVASTFLRLRAEGDAQPRAEEPPPVMLKCYAYGAPLLGEAPDHRRKRMRAESQRARRPGGTKARRLPHRRAGRAAPGARPAARRCGSRRAAQRLT